MANLNATNKIPKNIIKHNIDYKNLGVEPFPLKIFVWRHVGGEHKKFGFGYSSKKPV